MAVLLQGINYAEWTAPDLSLTSPVPSWRSQVRITKPNTSRQGRVTVLPGSAFPPFTSLIQYQYYEFFATASNINIPGLQLAGTPPSSGSSDMPVNRDSFLTRSCPLAVRAKDILSVDNCGVPLREGKDYTVADNGVDPQVITVEEYAAYDVYIVSVPATGAGGITTHHALPEILSILDVRLVDTSPPSGENLLLEDVAWRNNTALTIEGSRVTSKPGFFGYNTYSTKAINNSGADFRGRIELEIEDTNYGSYGLKPNQDGPGMDLRVDLNQQVGQVYCYDSANTLYGQSTYAPGCEITFDLFDNKVEVFNNGTLFATYPAALLAPQYSVLCSLGGPPSVVAAARIGGVLPLVNSYNTSV